MTVDSPATDFLDMPAADNISDDDLIRAWQDGDQGAFATLYERHRSPVFRFFCRQLEPTAAEDAFQETWAKFIRQHNRYQPQGKFRAYLFTIAYNVLHDWHRKQMRQPPTTDAVEELPAAAATEHQVERAELQGLLHQLIKRLPIAQRSAWLLRHEAGLSLEAIAQTTDSSLEGVKSRLRYANNKLAAGMQKYVGP
ncbi:MAG: sigma-70 family RNA polymerase sigma factor [Pseudomonadota bacterium]